MNVYSFIYSNTCVFTSSCLLYYFLKLYFVSHKIDLRQIYGIIVCHVSDTVQPSEADIGIFRNLIDGDTSSQCYKA